MTTSISAYFGNTLGTPLVNSRWSWGAQDARPRLVALRIWEAEIERDERGERVLVLLDDVRAGMPGHNERLRYIEGLRRGDAWHRHCLRTTCDRGNPVTRCQGVP